MARVRRPWTSEEDELLSHYADIYIKFGNDKPWNKVALNLPGRSNKDCRKRWMKLGAHIRKGSWTKEEDKQLQNAINEVGCKYFVISLQLLTVASWIQVATILKTRHAEQCSKRWQYHLDPSIDHTRWNAEADNLLLECYERHGRMWNFIKKVAFPQRSTTNIKNRCNLLLRRKQKDPLNEAKESRTASPSKSKSTWKILENMNSDWDCSDEKDSRSSKSVYDTPPLQPYICKRRENSKQCLVGHTLCHDYSKSASISIKGVNGGDVADCWQKSQREFGERDLDPPILSALLHQMRNQANLPPFFWLNNYFPLSDPLWDGIPGFEQVSQETQTRSTDNFLPENQDLSRLRVGSLNSNDASCPGSEAIIWHV